MLMVEKSINQIKSETFKALIGINLSKSLAEDCSNLCCNLAKTKTPFLKDLITLLEKYKIIFAGFLITFSYLPILWAFTQANVPTVAALREISILMTSIYGVYFLKERFGLVKVISAALIVLGCVIIRLTTI